MARTGSGRCHVGSADMRPDTTPLPPQSSAASSAQPPPHLPQSSAASSAQPPQPQFRRALDEANFMRSAFFHWYATDEIWEAAEPIFLAWDGKAYSRAQATSPAASSHPQPSSAASPACAAPRLSVQSVPCLAKQMSASKFLAALEEAAYDREDNPAQATLLRELANSLSSGDLLLMRTDEVWDLGEEQREEAAIKQLDKLIELVVSMRAAWIASPLGTAPWNAGRHLGPLEGNMSVREADDAARDLLRSMSREKRAEYLSCLQSGMCQQFLFALLRQPSFFKAEGLEKLLEEWANIKNSSEYKEAIE